MHEQPLRVFIGYDGGEHDAFAICQASLRDKSSKPLYIEPLSQPALRAAGLYRRTFYVDNGQRYDAIDGKPFSTEFSFSRFLVPALSQYQGHALFVDSDFLWRADVAELLASVNPHHAVSCVHHQHDPQETSKMRSGQVQSRYRRKNWSSLMLWNCAHPANRNLTPYMVNTMPGWWLHGLNWLCDTPVGTISPSWNWLAGYSSPDVEAKAVHYTLGTPDVPGHENAPYADEWRKYAEALAEAA